MSIVKELASYEKWNRTLLEKIGEIKWAKIAISFGIACCLGNAVVFHFLLPFFLPFWTIVQRYFVSYRWPVLFGGFLSMSLLSVGQGLLLLVQIGLYEIISRFKIVKVPQIISVLMAVLGGQIIWRLLNEGVSITPEMWLYIGYEAIFAVVMLLFMEQLFEGGKGQLLRWNEGKTMAAIVFLAAVLLGLNGLQFMHLNMAVVLFHVSVCVAAVVGSLPLSIIVATVVGLVFSISELALSGMISLYVLTGMAVGVVANNHRLLIAGMSVLPSVFFYFYDSTLPLDVVYFTSIAAGVLVFLFLPERLLVDLRESMQPVETRKSEERSEWVTERLKTAVSKVRSFSEFIGGTVMSSPNEIVETTVEFTNCQNCYKYSRCWANDDRLAMAIKQYEDATASSKGRAMRALQFVVQDQCVRSDAFLKELQQRTYERELGTQLFHGRQLVAMQLEKFTKEVTTVLEQLSDAHNELEDEELIVYEMLNDASIDCVQVDLIRNEAGDRVVVCHVVEEMTFEFWQYMQDSVIPHLNRYFGEELYVASYKEVANPFWHVQIRLTSARQFTMEHTVFSMPYVNHSGDVYSIFTMQEHLVGVALSDGMGHGLEARAFSDQMVRLLKGHLMHLEAESALHLMHYVVGLNTVQDVYASLDFLIVDLQTGELVYWKAGSVATYVLRRGRVIILENEVGPVGKSLNSQLSCQRFKLLAGDVIFIVSDGIYHSRKDWLQQEEMFVRAIERNYDESWPLESVLVNVMDEYQSGIMMEDDCTIIACRMDHLQPSWHAFTHES